MLPREVIRQVRRLHLKARRAVEDLLGGEYQSVFKGSGIAFEEVREYQPGDDIRTIDWNVTARTGHPFVKRFIEERERTLLLAVDCSRSQQFGSAAQQKREVAGELAAVLAFSAVSNNDRVGLLQFTDRVERFIPPRKGTRHVLRLIRDVLFYEPQGTGTATGPALDYLNRVLHRRTIIFLISDFLDAGFDASFKRTGLRHDLVAVRITDPREDELPNVGFLEVEDSETGSRRLVDTSDRRVRASYKSAADDRRARLTQIVRAGRADLVEASAAGGHLDALIRFFRQRERRIRRR
jgi:uncharacterized protein (DUF58 family)